MHSYAFIYDKADHGITFHQPIIASYFAIHHQTTPVAVGEEEDFEVK
jgi:hypothetical protein